MMHQGADEGGEEGNGKYVSLEQLCEKGDKAWWQVFDAGAKEVEECCHSLLRLYEERAMERGENNGSGGEHSNSSSNMEIIDLEPSEGSYS